MIRATKLLRAGDWPSWTAAQKVTLDFDHRYRRRLRFATAEGAEVLLDLPDAVHIRHGDALVLDDGSFVAVEAAPEALLEIRAADADALARIAWHLGNRHLAVQFFAGALRIHADHVIAGMVIHLGGTAHAISAPFDPEPGAYHHG
jgi:urease accessory protein